MNTRRYGCNFKSIVMCLFIVKRGIPSSANRLLVDFFGDLATDFLTSPHCRPLVTGLPVLGLPFMLPIAKSLCSHRSCVCFGGASSRIVVGNRHAPGSSSSLLVDVRVSNTENNPLFNGVIARITHSSFHLSCGRKRN
jgi:hypothetical protein